MINLIGIAKVSTKAINKIYRKNFDLLSDLNEKIFFNFSIIPATNIRTVSILLNISYIFYIFSTICKGLIESRVSYIFFTVFFKVIFFFL